MNEEKKHLDISDLKDQEMKLRKDLMNLKFSIANNKNKNSSIKAKLKKEIARLLTLINNYKH